MKKKKGQSFEAGMVSYGVEPDHQDDERPPEYTKIVRPTDLARSQERVKRRAKGLLNRFRPTPKFLVEMHFTNGSVKYYIVSYKDRKFNLLGHTYVIDESVKEWCVNLRLYKLTYHEDFALPYRVEVSSSDLSKNVGERNREISTSFSPSVLREVLKFEYVKGVIQGAQVSELVKRIFIVGIITLIAVLGHLAINAYKMGWI